MLLAMVAATFAQMLMGALGPVISEDLGITPGLYGPLVSMIFVSGLAASPLVGRLQERVALRWLFVGLFATATIGLVLVGAAPGALTIGLALCFSGMSLALAHPATNSLVALATPPSQWGTVMGVKQAGQMVSAVAAGSLLPLIASRFGWRAGVLWTGIAVALVSVPALALLRGPHAPPARRRERTDRVRHGEPRLVALLAVYTCLMGTGLAILGVYLPLFAYEVAGWSPSSAGQLVALLGVVGLFARLGWGRAIDRGVDPRHATTLIAALAMVFAALILVATPSTSWLLWTAAVGIGATGSAQSTVANVFAIRVSDRKTVALASSRIQIGFFVAFIVSPALFGASLSIDPDYRIGWAGVVVAWFSAAIVATRLRLRGSHT